MKTTSSSIKQITLCLVAVASAFALGACDSRQENAREDAVGQKADTMENKADAVRDSAENKADATRDAAEQKADTLENQADAVRDQSPVPTP